MTAYAIVHVTVTDAEKYKGYQALTPDAIASNGGRFLVRGGPVVTMEGEEERRRVVVLEFESVDAARAFYDSPEYRKARDARENAAEMQMIIVEGV
jgi:uncharacterized protein (DUF1330 family)